MSVTINFTATTESDVASVNVYESDTVNGTYTLVYNEAINTSSTSVTYAGGSEIKWYKISFVDDANLESQLSAAIYGSGSSWYSYMISIFRTEIDDWSDSPTYTDLQLKKKLIVAGAQLQNMGALYDAFDYTYTFSIDSGDGSGWNISPDPIYGSKDDNFITLWIYKSVCEHYKTALTGATSNAIKIKDGDSSIDTTASFGGHRILLESKSSACSKFDVLWNQVVYAKASSNGIKRTYANFGSDHIHRPEVFHTTGGLNRST